MEAISLSAVSTDFETIRIALMQSYNSQAITHVGYVVALVVAILPLFNLLISGKFLSFGIRRRFLFYFSTSVLINLIVYFICRISFWSWLGSVVLVVTPEQVATISSPTQIYGIQTYLLTTYQGYTHSIFDLHFWAKLFSSWGGIIPVILILTVLMMIVPIIFEAYWWRKTADYIQSI